MEDDPTPRIRKKVITLPDADSASGDQTASLMGLFAPSGDENSVLAANNRPGERSDGQPDLMDLFAPTTSMDENSVAAANRRTDQSCGPPNLMGLFAPATSIDENSVAAANRPTEQSDGPPKDTASSLDLEKNQGSFNAVERKDRPTVRSANLMDDLFSGVDKTETDPLIDDSPLPVSYVPTFGKKEPSQRPLLPIIDESSSGFGRLRKTIQSTSKDLLQQFSEPYTWFGAIVFLFYHTVFCLTIGSSLTRLNGSATLLGLFAKMAASGIIFASPMYWVLIGDIPALYPTVDLFAAPFLANIAINIDQALSRDPAIQDLSPEENDLVFLGSFCLMTSISILLTGSIVVLASVFRLANIGSFLPFPVLAGFFACVSILQWKLAFNLDVGTTVENVLNSGNSNLLVKSLVHHLPSVLSGILMKVMGPKHPFYVVGIVLTTIVCFYSIMLVLGISKEEATEEGWFWGSRDLVYEPLNAKLGFKEFVPPAPFGWINCIFNLKYIHWEAAWSGIQPAVALTFLYCIRINLHCPALRKTVPTLSRSESSRLGVNSTESKRKVGSPRLSKFPPPLGISHRGRTSSDASEYSTAVDINDQAATMVSAKPTNRTLKEMMASYGYTQWLCAVIGGFPVVPTISTASTMYKVRAEKISPQVGSCLLLLAFYVGDFRLVSSIPKVAFSSLLILACLDLISNFVIKSYQRTKEKWEWLCVPLIVVISFFVGLLSAVFLGIALSTFFFVASFFRSGVVKFISSGASIHSTIERAPQSSLWLDEHGTSIQILVLQNYLFFGNASSILSYIGTMFEDPDEYEADATVLTANPRVKIVLLDLTLVTGMDTSAVDIFAEILTQCKSHECKLFLAGVSQPLRQSMNLGGFRPDKPPIPSDRKLRFFPSLDEAIGKAEDLLLDEAHLNEQRAHLNESSFFSALQQIDQHHSLSCSTELAGLKPYMQQISIAPRQVLYEDIILERGLLFVARGFLKVQQNAQSTMTRTGGFTRDHITWQHSLNALQARTDDVTSPSGPAHARAFRLARVGPGSVIGGGESLTGFANPGEYVAVSHCVLHYISYTKLEELEESDPKLSLKLHKLLSHLMAKRQSSTINQLATLHSIMSSPPQKRPVRRGRRRREVD